MAVYTELSDEDIATFAAAYDLGQVVACKGIAEGVENTNYLLVTEAGPYILTIYERRVNDSDVPYFLELLTHLAVRGVPCPTPVAARDGSALRRLKGRPAAVVTFLHGLWPRRPGPEHCAALGAALAALHAAGADFPRHRANDLSPAGWHRLLDDCLARPDGMAPALADELRREMDALEAAWPGDLPAGVIHADLFPDNVFFDGGRLTGLIDFYFACTDMFAYDLAIAVNAWCFEPDGDFNVTKARRLAGAYHARRPLSPAEVRALPLLARGAAMRFLLTRLYDWLNTPRGALVTPKNPMEYLAKLRFHRGVGGADGYGLD